MKLRKLLQAVLPARLGSRLGHVPVSPDDVAVAIAHLADSHRSGLRNTLSQGHGTILKIIENASGPLEENSEAWKEFVCALWALAQSRVYAHVGNEFLTNSSILVWLRCLPN